MTLYYKGEKMEGHVAPSTDFHGFGDAIRRELARRIPAAEKLRALDVGTGFGANLIFLARHLSKGSKVWTVDPSEDILANAKLKVQQECLKGDFEFVRASAERLQFEDGFFDIVASVMVLHHIAKLNAAVGEISRVLRNGGRLLIVDYKPEAAHELEFQTRHLEGDFFRPEDVKAIVERCGLKSKLLDFKLWYLLDAEYGKGKKSADKNS